MSVIQAVTQSRLEKPHTPTNSSAWKAPTSVHPAATIIPPRPGISSILSLL